VNPGPGSVISDRYELREEIGRGGMATVWRAQDRPLKRAVAIKILRPQFADRPAMVARIVREAHSVASISHPNVVRLFDFGSGPDATYVVMELLDGRTLEAAMKDPAWPLSERLTVLEQVAEGVHAAHEAGVIHRDLKPGNVMIDARGRAVVMDFGLAHLVHTDTKLTMSGVAMGTPLYMAPEQARGKHRLTDARTDVHALGVTLYEMLTGRTPYDGANVLDICRAIISQAPRPPRALDPTVPPDLEAICLRALSKGQDLRYGSARAFAAELRSWRAGRSVVATATHTALPLPREMSSSPRKAAPRRRRWWIIPAAALLAAAAAWLVFRGGPAPAPGASDAWRARCDALFDAAIRARRIRDIDGLRRKAREIETACREEMLRDPARAEPHHVWGRALRAEGRFDEALARQAEALRLDPKHAGARAERALLLLRRAELVRRAAHDRWERRQLEAAHLASAPWRQPWSGGSDPEARRLRDQAAADLAGLEAPVARALAAWLAGEKEGALQLLRTAARGLDESDETLGRIALDSRDAALALVAYAGGVDRDPGSLVCLEGRGLARLMLAETARGRGSDPLPEYEMAAADFGAAVGLYRDCAPAWRARAAARIALAVCREAVRIDGSALLEEAARDCDEAMRADPRSVEARLWKGFALQMRAWRRTADPAVHHQRALLEFEEAARLRPESAECWERCGAERLAVARERSGLEQALGDFEKATALEPSSVSGWLGIGAVWLRGAGMRGREDAEEQYRKSEAAYGRAIESDPVDARTWGARGEARALWGEHCWQRKADPRVQWSNALGDLRRAIEINGHHAALRKSRAVVLLWSARHRVALREDAEKELREAMAGADQWLRLDPAAPEAYRVRGIAASECAAELARKGADAARIDELARRADADMTEAIRLKPDVATYLVERAQQRMRREAWEGALQDFERAAKLDGTVPRTCAAQMGECRRRLGKEHR